MTFEDKVNNMIGLPYDAYEAHCYSLVEELLPNAPKIEGTAKTLACSVSHFKEQLSEHKLKEIKEIDFKNKDMVVLGKNNIYFHIGVFYNDGVIHASEKGVVYQPMKIIKMLYTNVKGLRI